MAIGAGLLRRFERLQCLGRVVAHDALGSNLKMSGMVELDGAGSPVVQNDRMLRRLLRNGVNGNDGEKPADCCLCSHEGSENGDACSVAGHVSACDE